MTKPIGFYIWRGHWLTLCRKDSGEYTVRGLRPNQVSAWRADCANGKVKLQNP